MAQNVIIEIPEGKNLNNKMLMTDQEIIEVVTAHKEGKTIEFKRKYLEVEWHECKPNPMWDFNNFIYRVKEEPKYKPYKNAEEFLEASKKHGPYIKGCMSYVLPDEITNSDVKLHLTKTVWSYSDLLAGLVWQDGTPCGVIEK